MFLGAVLALFLVDAYKVVRDDNTKVILMKNPTWSTEIVGLWETLYPSPWILLLFPMFFSSNIFYTYQTNDMNGAHFNTRTRALNNLLYWLSQIIGALIFGYALDAASVRRSVRAKASLAVLFLMTFAIWGGGYAWQKDQMTRGEIAAATEAGTFHAIDWSDGNKKFLGPMFLYFFYGMYDAAWQTCIYWYMGALSNSGRKAANMAGFYKGKQNLLNMKNPTNIEQVFNLPEPPSSGASMVSRSLSIPCLVLPGAVSLPLFSLPPPLFS